MRHLIFRSLVQSGMAIALATACASLAYAQTADKAAIPPAVTATAPAPMPRIDPVLFAKESYVLPNGVNGLLVAVETRNPVDWAPLLKGDLGKPVTISAQLFMPPNTIGQVPAVIENPGSGNLGAHHFAHAATLTSAGIAVLVIDPFTARSIDNTMVDQYGQISWATTTYDVLAAMNYLRSRNDIDGQRLGATGGSRGGTAVAMAATAQVSDAVLGVGKGLKAVVAGYPWCGTQFHSARLARGAALLTLSGDKDDWVSFIQCQDFTHAMQMAGQNATMKLFPGALHAFDRAGVPPTPIPQAYTSILFPTVYMDDTGAFYNLRTGKVDPALTTQGFVDYAIKGGFMRKGVTVGTQGTQAGEYSDEMVAFFKRHL